MIDSGWDLPRLAASLWEKRGLPPAWVEDRTPHELVTLFGDWGDEAVESNPLTTLAEHNRRRAGKGLPPVVPSWLLREMAHVRME